MRVARLPAAGAPLQLVDRPVPEPGRGEVRVRVEACGVCGSDLFLQDGGFGDAMFPIVPGHEAAGVVDALGDGVGGLTVGQQVALYYISGPADSRSAQRGRPNVGPDVLRMGVDVDGAFAEYVVRPAETLVPVSEPIDPATLAVLTDAVATPYHALAKIARVAPAETVVVIGTGGIGSNAVQLGKLLGAHVIAVGRSAEKLRLAAELGADLTISTADGDVERAVLEATGAEGPDVVVQCVGSPRLDELAVRIAGFGGRVVFVGTCAEPFSLRATQLVWRELSLLGSRGFTAADIAEVVELHRTGGIRTDHLTARRRPLEEVNEALADLRERRVLRSVIVP